MLAEKFLYAIFYSGLILIVLGFIVQLWQLITFDKKDTAKVLCCISLSLSIVGIALIISFAVIIN